MYFDEMLEGTGQAEDYRLKPLPKNTNQLYELWNKTKHSDEFNHLSAIFLVFMSQNFYLEFILKLFSYLLLILLIFIKQY